MHDRLAARAGQVLVAVRLVGVVAVAVEAAVEHADVDSDQAMGFLVAVVVSVRRVVALLREVHPEGFPGREQLGGLELELLHRDGGHGASLGRSPPRGPGSPGGLPGPTPPMAPGRGPGVRYLTNVLYGHHRTVPIPGQSMPMAHD